jgi:adenine-specific DNA-methyltransferase
VARELLTESGSIFVQIGDENVHLVRALLDEIFGAGQYEIEDADRDSAVIRSAEFKLDVGYDRTRFIHSMSGPAS